jgi:two-component system, sensor histidine kinase PdtaS
MRYAVFILLSLGWFYVAGAQSSSIVSLKQTAKDKDLSREQRANAFTDLGWQYRRINLDSALLFLAEAENLLPKRGYDTLHFEYDYTLGTVLRYRGDYSSAKEALQRCLDFSSTTAAKDDDGRSNYALSIVFLENREFERAIEHVQQAREIYRDLKVTERELGALNVWATILKDITRHDEAEKIYLEAYAIADRENILYQLEPISNNLASMYHDQERYEEALPYYERALAINREVGDPHGVSTLEGNIGNLLLHAGNYKKAEEYLSRSIAQKEEQGSSEDLVGLRGLLGSTLLYLGEREKGMAMLEDSYEEAQAKDYRKESNTVLNTLIRSTYNVGMYEEAAKYQRIKLKQQRTEFDELLASRVNELNAQYQKEEQDQQIELLSTQNELQEARLSRQRLLLFGGGAILLLILGLLLVISRFYQKVKNQHGVITKALHEKEILLKEIHHRVKNNLQIVSSLLNLQARKIKDQKASEVLREGRSRVQSMSLIHQSLYRRDNLTGVNLSDYLERLCQSVLETYQTGNSVIHWQTDVEPIMLDVDSVVPLGLIVNELLTNTLKYAFPDGRDGRIWIHAREQTDGLELIVRDDGIGMQQLDQQDRSQSFGYQLIEAFQRKLKADLDIKSTDGTSVRLLIRNYQKSEDTLPVAG